MFLPILTALTLHAAPGVAAAPAPRTAYAVPVDAGWTQREIARIRRHFDGALAMLAARDLSGLSAAQKVNRAQLVARLQAYRDRGVFPHNYDFPGEAVPYFVDRGTGTLCAVAHLMASTGRRDIVDRVAAMDNNVWVPELKDDAEFRTWLDDNGLTIEEAARIQVPYMGPGPDIDPVPIQRGSLLEQPDRLNSNTTMLAVGTSLGVAALSQFGGTSMQRRSLVVLGVAAGAFALVQSSQHFTASGPQNSSSLGTVALVSGGLSLYTATRGFSRIRAAERSAAAPRLSVAPMLPVTRAQGAGLSISLTF